jgi:hypothetical protein
MTALPSAHAIEVLLALSESANHRHGWIQIDYGQLAGRLQTGAARVRELVWELIASGQCIPAAHGDLVYLTAEGVHLADAARQLVRSGTASIGTGLEQAARTAPR